MGVRSALHRYLQRKSGLKRAVFGHHKCASTWVMNVVGMAAGSAGGKVACFHSPEQFGHDLDDAFEQVGNGIVVWVNADYALIEKHDVHAIHVVRDPRDVIVSGYFSHRNSHPTEGWPTLLEHREALQAASQSDGILLEINWRETIDNIRRMGQWNYKNKRILELKYEDLLKNERLFLDCFAKLRLYQDGLNEELAWRAIKANRFEVKARGRKRGEEDVSSHYRSGKAGDWRSYFTEEAIQRFNELYGEALGKLGYEDSINWE